MIAACPYAFGIKSHHSAWEFQLAFISVQRDIHVHVHANVQMYYFDGWTLHHWITHSPCSGLHRHPKMIAISKRPTDAVVILCSFYFYTHSLFCVGGWVVVRVWFVINLHHYPISTISTVSTRPHTHSNSFVIFFSLIVVHYASVVVAVAVMHMIWFLSSFSAQLHSNRSNRISSAHQCVLCCILEVPLNVCASNWMIRYFKWFYFTTIYIRCIEHYANDFRNDLRHNTKYIEQLTLSCFAHTHTLIRPLFAMKKTMCATERET